MPNWVEGTLKVRGKFEDVKRWAKENLIVYRMQITKDSDGHANFESVPVPDGVVFDDTYSEEFEINVKEDAHIKDSRRHFVEPGEYLCFKYAERDTILVLRFKAAWAIDEDPFVEMSKHYGVDFRLYGCERGMEFNQEVIIEHGEVVKNDEIKFDDYEWECSFPDLGG